MQNQQVISQYPNGLLYQLVITNDWNAVPAHLGEYLWSQGLKLSDCFLMHAEAKRN